VIKANRPPLAFVVAAFALATVTPGVDILNLVTGDACRTDPLVAFPSVARGAEDGTVCVTERELRRVVVERLDATPFGLAVTFVARFPQAALVRIICLMTVKAAPGRVAEFHRLCMTTAALH
jgi:hypothetical protein